MFWTIVGALLFISIGIPLILAAGAWIFIGIAEFFDIVRERTNKLKKLLHFRN